MKNSILKNVVILYIVMFLSSCANENESVEPQTISFAEMQQVTLDKFGAELQKTETGKYTAVYPNSTRLEFYKNEDNSYSITGTKIGSAVWQMRTADNSNYKFEVLSPRVSLPNARPCSEHPSGEDFEECFDREWDEFCSDAVSCVFQAVNGPVVAILTAIHCEVCEEDEDEDNG